MAQKPSIPKGTRDFAPIEMARRNYIFNTIKDVFALYGFQQIETPAMENLSFCYERGEGVERSEGRSMLWKMRARAARGDTAAAEWLETSAVPKDD